MKRPGIKDVKVYLNIIRQKHGTKIKCLEPEKFTTKYTTGKIKHFCIEHGEFLAGPLQVMANNTGVVHFVEIKKMAL